MNPIRRFLPPLCRGAALAALAALALSARAASLSMEGVLGNSGEQGKTLVRLGPPLTPGMGLVRDDTGSFWERGGPATLNRYAADGRLLATYPIAPAAGPGGGSRDRLVRVGGSLLLFLSGKLYTLPLDAAPGTAPKLLREEADQVSFDAVDGAVALVQAVPGVGAGAGQTFRVFRYEPASDTKALLSETPVAGVQDISLLSATQWIARVDGRLHLFDGAREVTDGWPRPSPGERLRHLDGFWYGGAWHGTIRRFNADMEPDPGVVLGGGSGSFIGHVDVNIEANLYRGLETVRPGMIAVSGPYGIVQLLQWDEEAQQYRIVRRIGAVPVCLGLGLDRKGDVWFHSGYWKWSDGPDAPLRDCPGYPESPADLGAVAMLPNDNFAAPMLRNGLTFTGGPFGWNTVSNDLKLPAPKPPPFSGSAAYVAADKKLVLLAVGPGGTGTAFPLGLNGRSTGAAVPVTLKPATPVREWTSLAMKDPDTLLGAADGQVIELARDGADWRETRRWNAWDNDRDRFGPRIVLSADAGRLWVSDCEGSRVLCFPLAGGAPPASFGVSGQAGDDLAHLDHPDVLCARENRAIVFDRNNQRLVKLQLAP